MAAEKSADPRFASLIEERIADLLEKDPLTDLKALDAMEAMIHFIERRYCYGVFPLALHALYTKVQTYYHRETNHNQALKLALRVFYGVEPAMPDLPLAQHVESLRAIVKLIDPTVSLMGPLGSLTLPPIIQAHIRNVYLVLHNELSWGLRICHGENSELCAREVAAVLSEVSEYRRLDRDLLLMPMLRNLQLFTKSLMGMLSWAGVPEPEGDVLVWSLSSPEKVIVEDVRDLEVVFLQI